MKATQTTTSLKEKNVKRNWHLVDVKGKILGRTVPEIAKYLQGKHKRDYVSYLDCGDYVVVVNAVQVVFSGRKESSKVYTSYSGYPGGLKTVTLSDMRDKNPAKIIENAVSGMLPKNKYRSDRLRRLYVFKDENHKFQDKFTKS
jgi:large subunit ribosomal protein L13